MKSHYLTSQESQQIVKRRTQVWIGTLTLAAIGILCSLAITAHYASLAPTAAEVPGTFVKDFAGAYQELVLRSDGTFDQTVRDKATGDVSKSSGKWEYSTRERSGVTFGDIVFGDGFMVVHSYSGELNSNYAPPLPVVVILPIERHFGRLILWDGESGPSWEKLTVTQ